jgi:DNA-binding transcriptional MerR regulator
VLARQFGLSRTTLLYYDRIKLLRPSYRTHAEARLYSDADEARLRRIVTFRAAGVPLATVAAILEAPAARINRTLESRLTAIQREIDERKAQQRFVVALLKDAVLRGEAPARSKDEWVALLRACHFTDEDLQAWHVELERADPRAHARFLKKLGLAPADVRRVQAMARTARPLTPLPTAGAAD